MVDFGPLLESEPLEDPVDLLFFAPHDIPIVCLGLSPLPIVKGFVDAVAEGSFELDTLAD
jgi:hypothetical protein